MLDVTVSQAEHLDSLREKYDITLILAFGSQITGKTHRSSDLDIGLLFGRGPLTLDCISELQKIFPSYEVDPVWLNRADPLLLGQITSHSQLLSGPETAYHEFRCYAFQRYADFLPYLALEAKTNARRLEGY